MTRAEADQALGAAVRQLVLGRRAVLVGASPKHAWHRRWRLVAIDVLAVILCEIERTEGNSG